MNRVNKELLILVVGDVEHWVSSGRMLPDVEQTEFCSFSDISAKFLTRIEPDIILTPLLSKQFDVLDLVVLLDNLDYGGRVRAMAPPLPDPDIILNEIRFLCPALDFDLIEVQPGPKLRSV